MDTQLNIWRPASGYRTESGKSKWRCWNESRSGGLKQYETANGRPWLCDTREAALKKCADLNAPAIAFQAYKAAVATHNTTEGTARRDSYGTVEAARAVLAVCEARSVELETWFQTAQVERFIAGHLICWRVSSTGYFARYRDGAVHLFSTTGMFDYALISVTPLSPDQVRSHFAEFPNPKFTLTKIPELPQRNAPC